MNFLSFRTIVSNWSCVSFLSIDAIWSSHFALMSAMISLYSQFNYLNFLACISIDDKFKPWLSFFFPLFGFFIEHLSSFMIVHLHSFLLYDFVFLVMFMKFNTNARFKYSLLLIAGNSRNSRIASNASRRDTYFYWNVCWKCWIVKTLSKTYIHGSYGIIVVIVLKRMWGKNNNGKVEGMLDFA